MKFKKTYVFFLLVSLIVLANQLLSGVQNDQPPGIFHTDSERNIFRAMTLNPIGPGEYFLNSEHCRGCHGFDSAGVANIDEDGNSVNLFDHWQSTMMANSSRDPLWRAKVSHEILVNPSHDTDLQDKCTSCHAPMGKYTAMYHGILHFGLANLVTDSLGMDGVSCASCHTIDSTVGATFSGIIPYDTTRNIYGPFQSPMIGPMQLYEGYTPVYSTHMNEARLCSSCHTLFTQTADTSGSYTGGEFPEQATYHEYLNSRYPGDTITCQTCHMPHLEDAIVIANGLVGVQPRFPFNQHTFAGANSFMLTMIKNNKIALGSSVEDWKFDSSIAANNSLLRDSSIVLDLEFDSMSTDTAFVHVRIQNRAGHKFPSGYPSRRVVLQLVAKDANGDTIFKTGTFTNDYRVLGENISFEPHHDVICQPDIPQIYEMVMGDVNSQFTSVVERAAVLLKDNRIPPEGFSTLSPVYDTVIISNDALADPDFNKVNSIEGSGADIVHYHIPLAGAVGSIQFAARVFYQAVPPKWVDEMFLYSSAEIDSFEVMYNNADKSPFLVAADSLATILLATTQNQIEEHAILVFPTLSTDGKVFVKSVSGPGISHLDIYTSDGKRVLQAQFNVPVSSYTATLPMRKTMYLLKIQAGNKIIYRKIVRQ